MTPEANGANGVPRSEAYSPEVTLLKWSSSLARRSPRTFAVGMVATILGLALVWWGFGGQIGPVILAAVLLGGALGPLYFPTGFVLTNKKAYQKIFFSLEGHRWTDFDGYRVLRDGVYLRLSPTDLRKRYLKGMTLYFGRGNREQVLDVVRRFVPGPEGAAGEGGSVSDRTPPVRNPSVQEEKSRP